MIKLTTDENSAELERADVKEVCATVLAGVRAQMTTAPDNPLAILVAAGVNVEAMLRDIANNVVASLLA